MRCLELRILGESYERGKRECPTTGVVLYRAGLASSHARYTHVWAASRFSRWVALGIDDRSWGLCFWGNPSMPRDFAKTDGPLRANNR
jgi:hypothetical protein